MDEREGNEGQRKGDGGECKVYELGDDYKREGNGGQGYEGERKGNEGERWA